MNAQRPINRIAFIDGFRGVAILAVIFHHSFAGMFNYGVGTTHSSLLADIASSGALGVNLFFVLSGFVLYLPYVLGARRLNEPGGVRRFFESRARRLLPLYFFISAISLLFVLGHPTSRAFLVWTLLHVTVLFPFHPKTFLPSANWVLWSLGVEIWFSVLFPGLVWLAAQYSIGKLLVVTAVVSLAVRVAGYANLIPALSSGDTYFLSYSVVGRIDDFVFGMLAAVAYAKHVREDRAARWLPVVAGAAAIVGVCRLWGMWSRQEIPVVSAAFFNLPLSIGVTMIIVHLSGLRSLRALFETWGLRLLGMMCYSLYVWHGIVMIQFPGGVRRPAPYATYLGLLLVLSWFTYRYIEYPRASSYRDVLPQPL